jgi:hypothetical protein
MLLDKRNYLIEHRQCQVYNISSLCCAALLRVAKVSGLAKHLSSGRIWSPQRNLISSRLGAKFIDSVDVPDRKLPGVKAELLAK